MFSVHAINEANRHLYGDCLEQYFRLRHTIYVEGRGWEALRRPDGREIDAFDTSHATHLLGLTETGEVVAGSRLVPTVQPHLMSEVFPELARYGVPRDEATLEWTRFFVVDRLRESHRPSRAAGFMYCSIVEFCVASDVDRLTVVCEEYWFERLASIGWKPARLGAGIEHDGDRIVGLISEMSSDALACTRRFFDIDGSVLSNTKVDLARAS
jgi:acyl-homoserine lactone synthase